MNNPHIPGGGADPSIPPDALPGWVYTDDADSWYLVVGMPGGGRLLRLTDFAVMPPGSAAGALTLAGSIEMTVWPAGSEDAASEPQNR
ncbi:MAG: hypothetical protein ACRDXX_18860 [Stackebrandtia sp.]